MQGQDENNRPQATTTPFYACWSERTGAGHVRAQADQRMPGMREKKKAGGPQENPAWRTYWKQGAMRLVTCLKHPGKTNE